MPRPVEDLGELEKNSRVTLSQFRIGPSPIDDEVLLYGIGTADKDAPQGLDINMAVATGKVKDQSSLAASQVLLTYFGTREHSLNFNHLLNIIKSGADVNYQDTHGQTVLHQVIFEIYVFKFTSRITHGPFQSGLTLVCAIHLGYLR